MQPKNYYFARDAISVGLVRRKDRWSVAPARQALIAQLVDVPVSAGRRAFNRWCAWFCFELVDIYPHFG